MADPTTAKFGKFLIKLGDTSSPQAFVAPCGFTSKSLTLTKDLTDIILPDCDDPDAVSWVGRDVTSLSASVSGEGVLASESVDAWLRAAESTTAVNVEITIEFPAKLITWLGSMHIASISFAAEQGGRVTASVEMQSDGELTRTTSP